MLILPFVFGAVVGSFLNVCIYRLPLGLSIVSPPSHCPHCKSAVPFYYNVPIAGYLALLGRCARCKEPLGYRYPLVEFLTAILSCLTFFVFGPSVEFFVYFAFVCALVVITFIDLDHRIIPDKISLPGIVVGVVVSLFTSEPGVVASLIGAVVGGGILLAVAEGYYRISGSEGMGGGDIKLLAMIGAFLGWKGALVALFAGSFIGALIGVALMAVYGKNSKYAIPFGPFLAIGALFHLFLGDLAIGWYMGSILGA